MSFTLPEENTLGAVIGRGRRNISEATRRVVRAAAPGRASLGTGFLAIGAIVVVALRSAYGLGWSIYLWLGGVYPDPLPALVAWVILIAVILTTIVVTRVNAGELPGWMFAIFLAGLAAAVTMDLIAIWPLENVGRFATAAVTAGMALLVVVTTWRSADLLVIAGLLGGVLATAMLLNTEVTEDTIAQQITTLKFAVFPLIVGVFVVRGYRRMVQVELDRVLVQSTVSGPRLAVGMLASEELARLDLAAEELLESVASGRHSLPLSPATASTAAQLATELRLHLIDGRRETWLYHAINESDLLGRTVSLMDPGSLAGLLDDKQRDGLLSAVWLLVADANKRSLNRSVEVTFAPSTEQVLTDEGRRVAVQITLTTRGVPRNRADPAVWEALTSVGQYSDSTELSSLRVDIRCLVENPADQ